MANETLTPDLCVVGGDAAGTSLAAAAAVLGLRVVLIEPELPAEMRQFRSDLPLHALAVAARRVHAAREASRFGVAATLDVDFARVRDFAAALMADLALNDSDERLAALGVRVIRAAARFVDPKTVTAGGREIRAERYALALRAAPHLPPIRGLEKTPHLTIDSVLDLRELPAHLVVIGAGSTGLAVAQAFRRFGSEVTVLDAAAPLRSEDPECAQLVLDALAGEGVAIRSDASVERVSGRNGAIRVSLATGQSQETIEGTRLFIATGRRAAVDGYGLELAGVDFDATGIRSVDNLRTSNRRVFVIGTGGPLRHAARWQAQLILSNLLFRTPIRVGLEAIPRVTATDPEIAHVGLREDSARTLHRHVRVMRAPFFENERAQIEREGKGTIKLVATRAGRLVGATIVGAGAGDLIGTYALALARRMHVRDLAGPLFPHPSRAEIGRQAALRGLSRGLTKSWVQRIMSRMRLPG